MNSSLCKFIGVLVLMVVSMWSSAAYAGVTLATDNDLQLAVGKENNCPCLSTHPLTCNQIATNETLCISDLSKNPPCKLDVGSECKYLVARENQDIHPQECKTTGPAGSVCGQIQNLTCFVYKKSSGTGDGCQGVTNGCICMNPGSWVQNQNFTTTILQEGQTGTICPYGS